ncbi:serine/threonine protein kinase [Minicystis rosea]|nr:serine/threonine protein kinase [Minicystis rosea]
MELRGPRFPGYRTLYLIGRGGFGAVYAAEPETGGGKVAIKLARADRPDAALRLVHERVLLAEVGPPFVPAVLASGAIDDGTPYLVLEYVDAPTLAELVADRAAPLSTGDAVSMAIVMLTALEAVHARGLVHRDLKPENLFIGPHWAKIVDFGLVLAAEAPDLTVDGGAVGTAEYMAPEQCEGSDDVDARADIYAMGVILYEMLTGAPPFWGARATVQQGHLGRRPPRLANAAPEADIPRALDDAVLRCLAKDREERFESAAALRATLVKLAEDLGRPLGPRPPGRAVNARPAPAAGAERRTLCLLFFETTADALTVQKRAAAHGGELAHAALPRCVVVYGHDLGDNPARGALRAAHDLIQSGVAARVRLDVATVGVQTRGDGSRRYLSALFNKADRFPTSADPAGVSIAVAAAEVLSEPVISMRVPIEVTYDRTADPIDTTGDAAVTETLLGRHALVESLLDGARRAAREAVAGVAVVVGAAGHGKSHVLRALIPRLHALDPNAELIELRAHEPALGAAEQTVRDLLQRTLDLPSLPPAEGAIDLLRERLSRCGAADAVPAVAVALGWVTLDAPEPSMEPALRTLEAAPGALRSALTVAAGEALRRRAKERPVLILLDDAHQADEATLAALEYAALAEAHVPLWICALGRPAFAEEHPSWGERAAHREVHTLAALDHESAAILCRRLLLPVESVPDDAVARLVERTRGVPLLLVELLRGLRREGLVRKRQSGSAWYLATDELDRVPDLPLVEWLARRELDALQPALAAHARLLSLLGEEVSIPDVAGVLARLDESGEAELTLDAKIATRRLIAAGLLIQDAKGNIGFRHGLVREEIEKGVPEALRQRIHRAATRHYGAAGADADAPLSSRPGKAVGTIADDERRLAQLAYHAAHAGLTTWAESAYLALAERMRARHAYVPAERAYSRALDQRRGGDDRARLRAYRGRGSMRYRIGRYDDALADLAAARALAHTQGDVEAEIEILLDEAIALDWMHEYKSSEARVEAARALSSAAPSPLLEARLALGVGRSAHRFSREEDAARELEVAVTRAEALGDDGYETLVIALLMLGFIYQGLGRLDDAQRALDRSIALCEEHVDTMHLATAINNRALLWGCLGDRARMIADMERGVSIARALGQDSLELIARYNLGEYLYLMDDLDAAEPHVRRAMDIEERLRGDAGRPVVVLLDARFRYYRGEAQAARAIVDRIRARQTEAAAAGQPDALMVPSEDVLCAAVELATEDAGAPAWDALEERSARFSVGQEHVEVLEMRGLAALRGGRPDEAIAALGKAIAAAARIPNAMGARLRRRLDEATAAAKV